MSFQRRWFLTAAGTAFVASIGGMLGAAGTGPAPKSNLTGDPATDLKLLMNSFESGWGGPLKDDYQLCADFLSDTYKDLYVKRYKDLSDTQKAHLEGFASTLGRLASRNVEREDKGTCGWKQSPKPPLRKEHLSVAREQLGFYLNGSIGADKRCSKDPLIKPKENDEPCPLCLI